MKKLFFLIGISFVFLFLSNEVKSNHIMGSDMSWDCIGQDSFLITLNIYRDCNGINISTATISVKCKTTSQNLQTLNIPKPSPIDITPICKNSCTRCESSGCSFPYGIEKYSFQKLLILSNAGSCCEINLIWTSCCRNNTITTGMATGSIWCEATLNRCLTPCDNGPKFSTPPVAIICEGQDFTYYSGAFDIDSNATSRSIDSFGYEWIYPRGNGGANLSYTSPYDYNKPIFFWGFPNTNLPSPRGFHLDPYTGDISLRPMKIQQTVMSLKVSEYRNGVKIGEVNRDIQFIVMSCPANDAPLLSGPFYKEVCAGDTVVFNIPTMDYNTKDSLTISWDNSLIGANWTDDNDTAKHPTGVLSWTTNENQAGSIPYVFTVTVKDDACPVFGSSTRIYQILVKPLPVANITTVDNGCGNYSFSAQPISGAAPNFQWIGNFNPGFSAVGKSFNYNYSDTGSFPYTMTMTAGTGTLTCSQTYFDTIEITDYAKVSLDEDTAICPGESLIINSNFKSNYGLKKIIWSTGDTNVFQIQLNNLKSDKKIVVTAINDSGCVAIDSTYINVDNFKVLPYQLYPVCDGDEAIVYANPKFDVGEQIDSIKWIGLNCGCLKGTSDIFKTYFAAPFAVVAYNENGCMAADTITTVVHPLPNIISILPKQLCENDQIIQLDSFIEPLGGSWTLQGNSGLNKNQLDLNKLDSGNYVLFYEITDTYNCFNEMQIGFRLNNIPEINIKDNDSICSKTGNYLLNGLPIGGKWSGNIISQSGQNFYVNTDSVSVNNHQVFPLIYNYTDTNGCNNQDTLNLTIKETKEISFGEMKGCYGDRVGLIASPKGGAWSGFGVFGDSLLSSQTGIGEQIVFYTLNHMGCISTDSSIINIIPYPNQNIQLNNDTIFVEQGQSIYQWFRNDTLLTGETNYFIVPSLSGAYHCEISNKYGCITITQKVIFNSIDELNQKDFSVYPNPVINGLLTIDVSKLNLSDFKLLILDELGKKIYFEEITNNPRKINRKIEFPASGSYTVLVVSDGERFFKRIVVK